MRAIMESIFMIAYLVFTAYLGIKILKLANGRKKFTLFGVLALVLVGGDAFHLVPRIWALNTLGTEYYYAALGVGTLVTSITMTVFYVMLYRFWRLHYGETAATVSGGNILAITVYGLAAVRIALCLSPANRWLSADSPLSWGIYRNIPFALIGLVIIVIFARSAKTSGDTAFRSMWLAISLSFAFYLPVVLLVHINELFGLFMIPKTVAYIWMILMGYKAVKQEVGIRTSGQ
ncbi:MAG: hypothetical protein FWE20_06105 [Defluviitaleaceae bacterium]|nr:hypothetical protein [Defluviitaleaceae bacterium]